MSQVEREIKVLKVDVNKVKNRLEEIGIEAKGKYIQDVYTFDLPTVDELFIKYVNELILNNNNRGFIRIDAGCGHKQKKSKLALYCIDDGKVEYFDEKETTQDQQVL